MSNFPNAGSYSNQFPNNQFPPSRNASSNNPLLIPAVFILVMASFFLLLIVFSIPSQLMKLKEIDTTTPRGTGELIGMFGSFFLACVFSFVAIGGSVAMIVRRGYMLAMLGAISAVTPLCGPCFGLSLPFGIGL